VFYHVHYRIVFQCWLSYHDINPVMSSVIVFFYCAVRCSIFSSNFTKTDKSQIPFISCCILVWWNTCCSPGCVGIQLSTTLYPQLTTFYFRITIICIFLHTFFITRNSTTVISHILPSKLLCHHKLKNDGGKYMLLVMHIVWPLCHFTKITHIF
jgi:hypothetical protein